MLALSKSKLLTNIFSNISVTLLLLHIYLRDVKLFNSKVLQSVIINLSKGYTCVMKPDAVIIKLQEILHYVLRLEQLDISNRLI